MYERQPDGERDRQTDNLGLNMKHPKHFCKGSEHSHGTSKKAVRHRSAAPGACITRDRRRPSDRHRPDRTSVLMRGSMGSVCSLGLFSAQAWTPTLRRSSKASTRGSVSSVLHFRVCGFRVLGFMRCCEVVYPMAKALSGLNLIVGSL